MIDTLIATPSAAAASAQDGLQVADLSHQFGQRRVVDDVHARDRAGRGPLPRRPIRLRQDHHAAPDRGAGDAAGRADRAQRPGAGRAGAQPAARAPAGRADVPGFRPVPASACRRERGLRAQRPRPRAGASSAWRSCWPPSNMSRLRARLSAHPLRRRAAARGAGPRAGARAGADAARRGVLGAGHLAAGAGARRDAGTAARGRHADAAGDPRCRGGDPGRRPDPRHAGRADRAERHARRALRRPRRPVRGRLLRPGEPVSRPSGAGDGRRRRSAPRRPTGWPRAPWPWRSCGPRRCACAGARTAAACARRSGAARPRAGASAAPAPGRRQQRQGPPGRADRCARSARRSRSSWTRAIFSSTRPRD